MNSRIRMIMMMVALSVVVSTLIVPRQSASAQVQSPAKSPANKDSVVTTHAKGTFEVKVAPIAEDKADGSTLGRYSLDKQYHGDLEAMSKGEMLTAGSSVKGSAGYVAMERVSGTLNGRKGTFVLQHTGTMNRGTSSLTVSVVPDSGTDQLAGLTGTMTIIIADGKHSYEFEGTLPETH